MQQTTTIFETLFELNIYKCFMHLGNTIQYLNGSPLILACHQVRKPHNPFHRPDGHLYDSLQSYDSNILFHTHKKSLDIFRECFLLL